MRRSFNFDKFCKRVMCLQTCSGGEAGVSMLTHVTVGFCVDANMVGLLPKHSVGAAAYLNEKVNGLSSMIRQGTRRTILSMQKE